MDVVVESKAAITYADSMFGSPIFCIIFYNRPSI